MRAYTGDPGLPASKSALDTALALGDIDTMKRDQRKLNRVREAAQLIQRAVANGWVRHVELNAGSRGHGPGQVVFVRLESRKRHGCNGRILMHFVREAGGAHRVSVMSRFLDPRGKKRDGLVQAWTVFFIASRRWPREA